MSNDCGSSSLELVSMLNYFSNHQSKPFNMSQLKQPLTKITTGMASGVLVFSLAGCQQAEPENTPVSQAPAPLTATDSATASIVYADGVYTVDGVYQSPGGQEEIGVTLTLADGVITDAQVEPRASLPISKKMQEDFAANYQTQVLGQRIESLELGKVSGSSLTPKGFNDALEKIKLQAQS